MSHFFFKQLVPFSAAEAFDPAEPLIKIEIGVKEIDDKIFYRTGFDHRTVRNRILL
jgi:hypothetical protein